MLSRHYASVVDKHGMIRSEVHRKIQVQNKEVLGAHTSCVVFHSITTLEAVNMACCFAAAIYIYTTNTATNIKPLDDL